MKNPDGFNIFNLCGDEETSFLNLVKLVENKIGISAKKVRTKIDEGDLLSDNDKIKKDLDWYPKTGIEEGLDSILTNYY
jgi:nucleoside-diphosphate-sugar epimerase